jgi:hypothetical protein
LPRDESLPESKRRAYDELEQALIAPDLRQASATPPKGAAMRHSTGVLAGAGIALLLSAGVGMAADGQGLTVRRDAAPWSTWQGRVSVGNTSTFWRSSLIDADARPTSVSLMGDYYFSRSLLGLGTQGGFRATSGLIVGPRGQAWSGQPGLGAGSAFSVGNRLFGSSAGAVPYLRDPSAETATLPYLGVGYTGLSARGGWSVSADLGLVAQNPSNAVRLGRLFGSGQNLDDLVRDLRMTPMFQLGVSYAF